MLNTVRAGDAGLSGTADAAYGDVQGELHDGSGDSASATPNPSGGAWSMTFPTTPLSYGMNGSVHVREPGVDDGDRTEIWWDIQHPDQSFNVFLDNSYIVEDFEDGDTEGWSGDSSMSVVAAPANPNGGSYVGDANITGSNCAGQTLTLPDTTPDHVSFDFYVEGDTTHISGIAARILSSDTASRLASISFHSGNLRFHNDGTSYTTIMAASTDQWYRIELRNIDYAGHTYDLWVDGVERYKGAAFTDPVTNVSQFQAYACEPLTGSELYLDNIRFGTGDGQFVHGYQWPEGEEVTMTAQHPLGGDTYDTPFHTATATSVVAPWDAAQTFVEFTVPVGTPLSPGDLVTLSGATQTKDHVVQPITFTVNTPEDTVTGLATPGAGVSVGIHDGAGAYRDRTRTRRPVGHRRLPARRR